MKSYTVVMKLNVFKREKNVVKVDLQYNVHVLKFKILDHLLILALTDASFLILNTFFHKPVTNGMYHGISSTQ